MIVTKNSCLKVIVQGSRYIYIYTVYYRWYILLNWFLSGDPTGMRIKPACLWVPRFEPYIATGLNIYIYIYMYYSTYLFKFIYVSNYFFVVSFI